MTHDRRRGLRVLLVVCGTLSTWATSAPGAELRWTGPAACDEAPFVREEVERLIGRPLRDVVGMNFQVVVNEAAAGRWSSTIRTEQQSAAGAAEGAARERRIEGASCSEVVRAAAVAVALAVQTAEAPHRAPDSGPNGQAESSGWSPGRKPAHPPQAEARPAPPVSVRQERDTDGLYVLPALAAVLDVGSLPSPTPGLELTLSLRYRELRASLFGAAFARSDVRLGAGRGGEFELALMGLLLCIDRQLLPLRALGCAGFELGELTGSGVGVATSREGTSAWRAVRAEIGAAVPARSSVRAFARAGAAIPLVRREFVLDDGGETVHEPSRFSARAVLGVELELGGPL